MVTRIIKNSSRTKIEPSEYANLLKELKEKIATCQLKAALAVNKELIKLYWELGREIVTRQKKETWGTKILETIAKDLQKYFPGIKGFSRSNIFRMRAFYLTYAKVAQPVRQLEKLPVFLIPWGHNIVIFQRLNSIKEKIWYANMTIEHGWSRSFLEIAINSNYFARYGNAVTNFKERLPDAQSKLAEQTIKDPYNFDFLTLSNNYKERELENGLIKHIEKFLIELGQGFSFVGRQYHLEIGNEDYYIDLLFYHLKLRCYCVIELKNTKFKPEYVGKMNFYLSIVDDLLKKKGDNPSIGLILCKTKNTFTAEYALRDIHKPMGISEYEVKILESLPDDLKSSLPSIEEIEEQLTK